MNRIKTMTVKNAANQTLDSLDRDIAEKRKELRRLDRLIKKARNEWLFQRNFEEELRTQLAEAAKLVKIEGDAVSLIVRAAGELMKHYDDVTDASLFIYRHREDHRHVAFCQIPLPIPARVE